VKGLSNTKVKHKPDFSYKKLSNYGTQAFRPDQMEMGDEKWEIGDEKLSSSFPPLASRFPPPI